MSKTGSLSQAYVLFCMQRHFLWMLAFSSRALHLAHVREHTVLPNSSPSVSSDLTCSPCGVELSKQSLRTSPWVRTSGTTPTHPHIAQGCLPGLPPEDGRCSEERRGVRSAHCSRGGHWGMAYPGGHGHPAVFIYKGVAVPALFSEPLTKPLWRSLVSEDGQTLLDLRSPVTSPSPSAWGWPRVPRGLGATVDPKVAHQFTDGLPPPALCPSPDISHEHQAPLRALEPPPASLEEARLQLQCARMPHPTPTHLIHGLYGAWKLQLFNYFKHPPYTPFQ